MRKSNVMYFDPLHGILRVYNIVGRFDDTVAGYGSRKRGHVLRARDGFAKQDVRATQTPGVKFPGVAPADLVLAKRRVVETRDTHRDVPCSRIDRTGDLTNVMHELHASRMTQILFYFYFFFLPITNSAGSYLINEIEVQKTR